MSCRIGFVGAGAVAERHARVLAGFPDVRLVAVTDPDQERRRSFARRHGGRAVPDLAALLDTGLDAAYVCVPAFAHGQPEESIASAGVNLFVEKPLGLDWATPHRVARLLDGTGVLAAVGHHWRYSATVRRAQRLLRDRPVRLLTGAWLDQVPPSRWWAFRRRFGGQVVEQAVHVLDLARLLCGEVTEVYAVTDQVPPHAPSTDAAGATTAAVRFDSGAVGTLATTCVLGWRHRAGVEVCADGLALLVTEDGLECCEHGRTQHWSVDPAEARRAADRAFVDAVLGRTDELLTSYPDALRTHRLACAIAGSAAQGRPIHFPGAAPGSGA
ncbi:Gfo/Idh/MocA family protein [Goodfellowiella coeruleoviolacea]|uniref:Dehydrogenase n=1 Tax=Goodfellowiella coeruleoviolacea TaxID=334858 RepID=A0AAE3GK65_9PSEU|nr:Gfo/Idh/MocA family oxidoreductase [Goodfellowiella coeruleoviolacea]MCP2169098.1 putative dehydrogenase [Goodfellowiella coeruleoviolacea]